MSKSVGITSNKSRDPAFSEIAHTADYALRIRGEDFTALLLNAAAGLYSLIRAEENEGGRLIEKQMTLNAPDAEGLLVEWLAELAFWVEASLFVGTEIRFTDVSDTHLEATVSGRNASAIEKLIKAVTYHDLRIRQTETGLEATVVFDV